MGTATWEYSTVTILWLFLSGVFSFMYNICQFTIVHTLSPSATAFGGNFNKAALTFMTLLLPFLQTKANPPMPYIALEWGALFCNIAAFSMYSHLQIQKKQREKAGQPQMKSRLRDCPSRAPRAKSELPCWSGPSACGLKADADIDPCDWWSPGSQGSHGFVLFSNSVLGIERGLAAM